MKVSKIKKAVRSLPEKDQSLFTESGKMLEEMKKLGHKKREYGLACPAGSHRVRVLDN